MGEWLPIESAPAATTQEANNLRVIVFGGIHKEPTIVLADGEWWRMRKREGSRGVPTHWMPLPAPPEPQT